MASNIVARELNGVLVPQRKEDGFINATAMCTACDKELKFWLHNKETLELFIELAKDLGINSNVGINPTSTARLSTTEYVELFPQLITLKKGSPKNGGGTYLHPDLAIQLAQWCSPRFAIQVSRWVKEWITSSQIEEDDKFREVREQLKATRRELTDAIRDYLARHDDLSPSDRQWMYKNVSDMVNVAVFGCSAKKLTEKLGCDRDNLREELGRKLGWKALLQIQKVEDTATIRIDEYDEHPRTAIESIVKALIVRQIQLSD